MSCFQRHSSNNRCNGCFTDNNFELNNIIDRDRGCCRNSKDFFNDFDGNRAHNNCCNSISKTPCCNIFDRKRSHCFEVCVEFDNDDCGCNNNWRHDRDDCNQKDNGHNNRGCGLFRNFGCW